MISQIRFLNTSAFVAIRHAHEHQQKRWMRGTFYEAGFGDLLPVIYQRHQGASFLDVGACIGNHSLFFALACNAKSVTGFEPFEFSFDHYCQNLTINHLLDRVTPMHCALGARDAMVRMRMSGGPGNIGMCKVTDEEVQDGVPMHTLDALVKAGKVSRADVWKVDVEGHNMQFLTGAEDALAEWRPTIYIEAESTPEINRVRNFLQHHGYRLGKSYNATPTYEFLP